MTKILMGNEEGDKVFNLGYKKASEDIEKGKNLRKRMFEFGYNQALAEKGLIKIEDELNFLIDLKFNYNHEGESYKKISERIKQLQELNKGERRIAYCPIYDKIVYDNREEKCQ